MRVRCLRRPLMNSRPSRVGPRRTALAADEIGVGVEVFGDADGVPQDRRVDVVGRVGVDAAHQLHEPAGLGLSVAAGLVYRLAYQVDRHSPNFRVFQIRES